MVPNGDLVGRIAGGQSEHKLEIPDTYPNLDAVGVRLTIVRGLGDVQLRLC